MERNGAEPDNIINRDANLKDLIVRPITPGEENEWNTLMAKHHYLGFHCLSGRRLKYVALLNGRWVALIGWGAVGASRVCLYSQLGDQPFASAWI